MEFKDISQKVIRNFKLTTLALQNRTSVFLLTAVLAIFGMVSYNGLPKELFPDVQPPYIMVQTPYFGNPPKDIENLITRPIEKELESIKGIKYIQSTSAQDASMIFIEFNPNIEIKEAKNDVEDAVSNAKNELPNDLTTDPLVMDIDLSEFPIINLNMYGDYSMEELKNYAEILEERIETIYEVSKVQITGITEKEVKVDIDVNKMMAVKIGFRDIEGAIRNENVSMSGGEINLDSTRHSVRIVGEFESVEEIGEIIVKHEQGNIVYLKNIVSTPITLGYEEATSFTRLSGKPVVSLQVIKKGGENLLSAIDQVNKIVEEAKEDKILPDNLHIEATNDQSEMINKQLNNLENSMIISVIFVIGVLFFFLGTRNALFVGLAIPMSMFLSFVVLNAIGYRINMMVLFGLILALGMLVDNAIVVVENIYRFVDQGYSKMQAARQAVGEIAVPIIASTATTLAAFVPLAFWDSMIGEFMKYLPITLIIVLSSSLFVALVIIPVFSSAFITTGKENPRLKRGLIISAVIALLGMMAMGSPAAGLNLLIISVLMTLLNIYFLGRASDWFQNVFLVRMENAYVRFLRFALRGWNPIIFMGGTIFLLFFTIGFYFGTKPKIEFFPENDPSYVNIIAELPIGTDITATNEFADKTLEKDIWKIIGQDSVIVKSVLTNVGAGAVGEDEIGPGDGVRPNKAMITVTFKDFDERGGINTSDIMTRFQDSLSNKYPGVRITVAKNRMGPPSGKPINIEVSGKELDLLIRYADTIQYLIGESEIEGIEELKMDLQTGKQEIMVHINRDKARRYGLNTMQIAGTIRTALFGSEVSDYKEGEEEYPIMVRMDEYDRNTIEALMNQKITFRNTRGKLMQVPISSVADADFTTTYGSIRRKDMNRVITLSSNVKEGYNANEINEEIKELLADVEMPDEFQSYEYSFTGEQQDQQESMEFMSRALMIAIALILLILVSQFNSVVKPFIILASILFSTIGVFGGLATFQMNFIVVMTGIGIISLAGVVVNNAIVLIDYIDLIKKRTRKDKGLEEGDFLSFEDATECVVQAGKTRLRPVLLTAITTILGLFPMAMGMNIDFAGLITSWQPDIYFGGDMAMMWGPLSWTVIFGLTFATFLTLVIVPVMYRIATRAKYWLYKYTGKLKEA